MSFELITVLLETILVFFVCHIVGRLFFILLRIKEKPIYVCASAITGMVLLSMQLWVFGLLGIPWNILTLLLPWLGIALLLHLRKVTTWRALIISQVSRTKLIKSFKSLDLFSKCMLVLTLVFIVSFLIMLAVQPFNTSDILAFWGYKAQEFYVHESVYINEYLKSAAPIAQYYHIDYPPLWPLMADVSYTIFGGVNETLFKTTQAVLLISGAATFLAFLKESVFKKFSPAIFALVFALVAAPQFSRMLFEINYMGYADYPLAILILVSTMFFVRSTRQFPNVDTWLALLFAGAVAVTKNEGLPFFTAVVGLTFLLFAIDIIKSKKLSKTSQLLRTGTVILIISLPIVAWSYFKYTNNIHSEFKFSNFAASNSSFQDRIHTIFRLIWLYIKTNPPYIWQALAIVISLIATIWIRNKEMLLVAALLIAQLSSYVLSYFLSPYDLKFHILSSIDRLSSHVLPLILLLLGLALTGPVRKRLTKDTE